MMQELLAKTVGLIIATASMYLPLAQMPNDDTLFGIIREYGSFGVLILFVLGFLWILKGIAPIALGFVQKTVDGFLTELQKQREAREAADSRHIAAIEKIRDDFREMFSAHKTDLVEELRENTGAIQHLAEELKNRPCQK